MKQSFRQIVYEIAQTIPAGKVVTYGQLAAMAGSPKAARAVGLFMKNNPDNAVVPCHRVVGSDGRLIDFRFGGIEAKRNKLLAEGVQFKDGKVDLAQSRWELTSQ